MWNVRSIVVEGFRVSGLARGFLEQVFMGPHRGICVGSVFWLRCCSRVLIVQFFLSAFIARVLTMLHGAVLASFTRGCGGGGLSKP